MQSSHTYKSLQEDNPCQQSKKKNHRKSHVKFSKRQTYNQYLRPIISIFANTDGSFLNNVQRVYSALVGISPNVTTVVQIWHDKSRV